MKDNTRRNLLLVTGGRISLLGIWFIGNIILMRQLAPASFGVYALAVACIKIFTGCLGDALDLSVMRQVPLHLKTSRSLALDIIRSSFWIRTIIGATTLLAAVCVPSLIARLLLGGDEYFVVSVLVGIGIVADLLSKSSIGYLQASEDFARFMLLESLLQIGRFLAVIVLILTGSLTAVTAVSVFAIAPLAVFLVSLLILPSDVTAIRAGTREQITEMIGYAKWIAFSMAMAALYERVDMLLLGVFWGAEGAGLYSAALALATIPDHFTGCIATVLQPKVPGLYHAGRFSSFTLRYFSYTAPIALIGILGAWLLGGYLIETFLSDKYHGAILAFKILGTGSLIGLVLNPLPNALVAFVAPRRLSIVTAVGLFISVGGGFAVIPKFGVIGAAILIVALRIVISIGMTAIAFVLSSRHQPDADAPQTDWSESVISQPHGGEMA